MFKRLSSLLAVLVMVIVTASVTTTLIDYTPVLNTRMRLLRVIAYSYRRSLALSLLSAIIIPHILSCVEGESDDLAQLRLLTFAKLMLTCLANPPLLVVTTPRKVDAVISLYVKNPAEYLDPEFIFEYCASHTSYTITSPSAVTELRNISVRTSTYSPSYSIAVLSSAHCCSKLIYSVKSYSGTREVSIGMEYNYSMKRALTFMEVIFSDTVPIYTSLLNGTLEILLDYSEDTITFLRKGELLLLPRECASFLINTLRRSVSSDVRVQVLYYGSYSLQDPHETIDRYAVRIYITVNLRNGFLLKAETEVTYLVT